MFYGNEVLSSQVEDLNKLYESFVIEYNNFGKICYSLKTLNENSVLLEVDMSKIKERIKSVWEALKKFVVGIFNKIVGLLGKRTPADIKKQVEEKFEEAKDEEGFTVKIRKPTDEFLDVINNKYFSLVKKYNDKIQDVTDIFKIIAKGQEYDKDHLATELDSLDDLATELDNIFSDFGGIKGISSSNDKCFDIIEINNKEEAEKIKQDNLDTAKRNKELLSIVNKSVSRMSLFTGELIDDNEEYNFSYTKQFQSLVKEIHHIAEYLYNVTSIFVNAADYIE